MKQIIIRMPDEGNPHFLALLAQLRALPRIQIKELALDPLDVAAQLDEMRGLSDGWLDGQGLAPDPKGLDWLARAFEEHWPDGLPKPRMYPTPEGGVQAEWSIGSYRPSLEIDLALQTAYGHLYDLRTKESQEKDLDLNEVKDWRWLAERIGSAKGDAGDE